MKRIAILAMIALSSLSINAQAAKYYKWKDANGRIHYSQTPPKHQKNAKAVNVRSSKGGVASARDVAPASDTGATTGKPKLNAEQQKVKKLEDKLKKQNEEQQAQRCKTMKQNLAHLQQGGRIFEMADGKRKYLSGAQIDKRLQQVQSTYGSECN